MGGAGAALAANTKIELDGNKLINDVVTMLSNAQGSQTGAGSSKPFSMPAPKGVNVKSIKTAPGGGKLTTSYSGTIWTPLGDKEYGKTVLFSQVQYTVCSWDNLDEKLIRNLVASCSIVNKGFAGSAAQITAKRQINVETVRGSINPSGTVTFDFTLITKTLGITSDTDSTTHMYRINGTKCAMSKS